MTERLCPCGASLADRHPLARYCLKCSVKRDHERLSKTRKDRKNVTA